MADTGTLVLTSHGLFSLGSYLSRLDATLVITTEALTIVRELQPLRDYVDIQRFEDIGEETTVWHDRLAALPLGSQVVERDLRELRASVSRWQVQASERMNALYLITPASVFDAKRLISGLEGFVSEQGVKLLRPIEAEDLREALRCILISHRSRELVEIGVPAYLRPANISTVVGGFKREQFRQKVRQLVLLVVESLSEPRVNKITE